jgi:hypothetical protein
MDCSVKLKINEYVSFAQLKRKFKAHFVEQGYSEFKPSVFSQGLVLSLILILEDMISESIKNVNKDTINGLYVINSLVFRNMILESDKYDFSLRYLKKYNSNIKYHESLFFNIKKVLDNLETKHGSKLMIDTETKNIISYILLSLQYEIINMALKIVKYSNKKTLNNNVLEIIIEYCLNEEMSKKIKLKLDSLIIQNNDEEDEKEDEKEDVKEDVKDEDEEVSNESEEKDEVSNGSEEKIEIKADKIIEKYEEKEVKTDRKKSNKKQIEQIVEEDTSKENVSKRKTAKK